MILHKAGFYPNMNVTDMSTITDDLYNSVMNSIQNKTAYKLRECSLSKELDAVSSNRQILLLCFIKLDLFQAAEGTGLAFIVFTQAIVELPGGPFWAVIFFMMLLSLGIGSQIGILEGMLCTVFDIEIFKRIRKEYITGKYNKSFNFKKKNKNESSCEVSYSKTAAPIFFSLCMCHLLLCWLDIHHWSWGILVETLRFFRWYYWTSCGSSYGDDLCHLYLRAREIHQGYPRHDRDQTWTLLAVLLALLGTWHHGRHFDFFHHLYGERSTQI